MNFKGEFQKLKYNIKKLKNPRETRFLSYRPDRYQQYIDAARDYVAGLDKDGVAYLYTKPYCSDMFFTHMFNVLSLLQALNLKTGQRILEVGCGPGWITEILIGLGYVVDSIEPSQDMIDIAEIRVQSFVQHLHISTSPAINFYCTTMEECDFAPDTFNAIIFYDTLHHIVDEDLSIQKCFNYLVPGGILGIHEGAWIPGNKEIESSLENEMKRCGTLENPFTVEYLDYLLAKKGFDQIQRYHQVNGLFAQSKERCNIREAASALATHFNIVTAIKPYDKPTTIMPDARTSAKIAIIQQTFSVDNRKLTLTLKLFNSGETIWLKASNSGSGYVTIALFKGSLGETSFQESYNREHLSDDIYPECQATMDVDFTLPEDYKDGPWYLDLVNEGFFWFSTRDTVPATINILE